ncbi:hypothetical protein PI124_g5828 [Phytophthora idaei]|nr:hypothetical protein PI124_g5828 [Phytophthora idaei]
MFVHKDAADTYGWTKLIALKNLPFTHVDDPISRSAIRYKAMDRATLLKRMVALGLRFLAFSPFQDESSMTAAEHIDFLDMVLSQYGLVGWTKVQVHRHEVDPRNVRSCRAFLFDREEHRGLLAEEHESRNLEVIIFLKLNWDLVTLADVLKAIQESRSNTDAERE